MNLKYGTYTIQGHREYQEDAIKVVELKLNYIEHCYLLLLCDGHSGDFCSKKTCEILPKIIIEKFKNISKTCNNTQIMNLLNDCVYNMDNYFCSLNEQSGTTCVFCFFLNSKLFIVNIGDSRCIIGNSKNQIIFSTIDHKPNNINERWRIETYNGSVILQDTYRVFINESVGGLAISRVLGDSHYKGKNIVICKPDISLLNLITCDDFIVLASDGLWDVLSNQFVIDFIRKRKHYNSLNYICKQLVEYAYNIGSMDNITVIICKYENVNKQYYL